MKTFVMRRSFRTATYLFLITASVVTLMLTGSWVWYLAVAVPGILFSVFTYPAPHKPVSQTLADARADVARPGDDAKI